MAQHPRATTAEREQTAKRLSEAEPYGDPRRVWVDDGHVFVVGRDGKVVSMTPDVAIEMGRRIGNAGADSLVNQIMDPQDSGTVTGPAKEVQLREPNE